MRRERAALAQIEFFTVDFVKGFPAAWLNKQQQANEWRTSVNNSRDEERRTVRDRNPMEGSAQS